MWKKLSARSSSVSVSSLDLEYQETTLLSESVCASAICPDQYVMISYLMLKLHPNTQVTWKDGFFENPDWVWLLSRP